MASTIHQRRRRAILLGVGAALVLIFVVAGKDLVMLFTGPKLPGYAQEAPAGDYTPLEWAALQQGKWQYGDKPDIPSSIAALSGKTVCVRGFLLPLHEAGEASSFFVAKNPRGCYFCNPPGVAEVAQVNVAGGEILQPTNWPVTVYGAFRVATGAKDDSVLYTIDDATLVIGR